MARSATGHDAPDPSLAGPIRNIVKSAHKWGGNGVIPKFDKIKRVLLSKHPEVIARAFGGDANKAAAWIKDNWMAMHGHDPTHWRGKGKTTAQQLATEIDEDPDSEYFAVELSDDDLVIEDLYQEVPLSLFDEGVELFLADAGGFEERDGLIWTPICRTGTWMRSPLPGGKPLKLTKDHFDQAVDAFNGKAWEYVTIPLTHDDRVDENTGYIQGLEIRDDPTRPGEYRLWGGHKFTEPEIEEKVRRKSIIGRSVLLAIGGHRDTESGKFWPTVLKHVALTNRPWLNGLNDGVLAASQDGTAPTYEPQPDDESDGVSLAQRVMNFLRNDLELDVADDGMTPGAVAPDVLHRFVGRYGGKCALCGKRYSQANHHGRGKTGRAADPGLRDQPSTGTVYTMELGDGGIGDLALGWLERRGVKRTDLAASDFLIPEKKLLPYKVHGKVDEDGWKAAWSVVNGGHGFTAPSGYTTEQLKKKLLGSKPKGVEVQTSIIITKGGVGMGEGNEGGELRLSEEQLREMMTKAAQEAVAEERQRWDTDKAALEARLSQEEAESHRLRVDQQISAYQEKGVPPAVLTRVRELMLAQPSEGGELKLSQPDADGKPKEVTLSFGDAVQSILDSIPEALLEKGQKDLSLAHGGNGGQPPEGDDPNASIEKKVDSLIEFMKGGPAVHAE